MTDEIDRVIAGLTEAQRAAVSRADVTDPALLSELHALGLLGREVDIDRRWFEGDTFHMVERYDYYLTSLGLSVRARLQERQQ